MGSDGTLGLRAIKEKGGGTFVQEPASAKYVSMPESALDAGWADFVAPVESLPGKIIAYLKHAPLIYTSGLAQTDKDRRGLEKIPDPVARSGWPRLLPLQKVDRSPTLPPACPIQNWRTTVGKCYER